jgi:hypothetical protein
LLVVLIHGSLCAQPATRFGVYEGMGFTAINYTFLGREHDRKFESMAHIGLVLEIPVAKNVLLSFRPALTTLNGNADLAAKLPGATDGRYHRSFVKEQWVLEAPLSAKAVLNGREARPYFSLGGFLDINSNPAEIRLSLEADPSQTRTAKYSTLYGGLMAAVGVEFQASTVLLITPELAVRQFLSPPIETELISQANTPRFLFSIGILFLLSSERW